MFKTIRDTFSGLAHHGEKPHASADKASKQDPAEETHQELKPLEEELNTLISQLEGMADKTVTPHELRPIRQRLGHIDSFYHEGRFNLPGVQGVPPGQARVADMLNTAHELLRARLESTDYYKVSNELRTYHDRLTNIQHALEAMRDKPNLQPRDIRSYRNKLGEIDAHYHMAGFEVNQSMPEGQAIIADLLNTCHETVRELLLKTDYYKVDPALYSLHDRLASIVMGLEGLQGKESLTEKDVAKYRNRLEAVDKHYVEGKFVVDGKVPEGQAVLAEMLEKAHALIQELQDKMQ